MLSWQYHTQAGLGYWGIPTSTENFCEEDYNITHFCAEFVNCLTSIGYVLYAWHGTRMVSGGRLPNASGLPYLALAVVGVFSAIFHATLWVETQRCDGLSMLVAAAAPFYRVMTFGKSKQWSHRFAYALLAWLTCASTLYVASDILIVHQATFALLCFGVAFKTRVLMRERVKSLVNRRRLLNLAHAGTASGLIGFAIWLIDQFACSRLRAVRDAIGLPWGFLFEFHGWWHLLTGVSSYVYMTLVEIILTDPELKQNIKYANLFAWPISYMLALRSKPRSNSRPRQSKSASKR